MLQSWMRFRSQLVSAFGEPGGVDAGEPMAKRRRGETASSVIANPPHPRPHPGFWRLLASNNREVGRSFLLYDSFHRAQAHVTQIQAEPDALAVSLVRMQRTGARGWVITFEDSPVMMCSRWYDSVSTGITAAEGALAALPNATLAPAPDQSSASGRFRRRTVHAPDAHAW